MPCTGTRVGNLTVRPPVLAGVGLLTAGAVAAATGTVVGAAVAVVGLGGALVGVTGGAAGAHASTKATPPRRALPAKSRTNPRRSIVGCRIAFSPTPRRQP